MASVRPTRMSNLDGAAGNAVGSLMSLISTAKQKWDSSGANEAVGRMAASIPDSTKTYVGSMFKREHLRSVTVFFGIGEERPYYLEKNPSLLMERLRHNSTFFYLNYMLVTATLFFLTLLVSPVTIIGCAILAAAWMWLIRASQSGTLIIQGISIPQKTAVIAMSILSCFFLIWLLSGIFWWTLFSSGFLVVVHAFFRDASMHKDMEDAVAMEGDLHLGEDASFLNVTDSKV